MSSFTSSIYPVSAIQTADVLIDIPISEKVYVELYDINEAHLVESPAIWLSEFSSKVLARSGEALRRKYRFSNSHHQLH